MKVVIDKYDDLGQGLAKIQNKVCFIKGGIPNEIIDIDVIKDNKNYSVGIIKEIINKSNFRVNPICKYYNECGGCDFLHMKEDLEINFKIERYLNYFNRLDKFYKTSEMYYRNKIILHAVNGIFGLFKEKSNYLIPIQYCYLVKEKINEIINLLNSIEIDNKFNGQVLIRVNNQNESIVAIDGNYKYIDNIVKSNLIDNLVYNGKVLKGNNYYFEYVVDFKFKVNYQSFFQVNILGLETIYKIISNYLQDKDINEALDLYSGTSVLGIMVSKYVNKITSIEINKEASTDALENITINNINNLVVINGLVEDYIDKFNNIDLVMVDPARRGLDKKTIEYLNKIEPKYLIYISCNISSLKRDLKDLSKTFNIDKLYGVDMFPKTRHCESIVILERK